MMLLIRGNEDTCEIMRGLLGIMRGLREIMRGTTPPEIKIRWCSCKEDVYKNEQWRSRQYRFL